MKVEEVISNNENNRTVLRTGVPGKRLAFQLFSTFSVVRFFFFR